MTRRGSIGRVVGAHGGRGAALAVALASLALAACSSGGSSTASTTSSAATTTAATSAASTSTTGASTTTAPGPPAAPVDVALAKAGTVAAQDLPAPWTRFDAGGVLAPGPTSCSYRPGGPEAALRTGAAQRGVTMKFGATSSYLGAFAYAFPDAATASAWLKVVESPAWVTCQERAFQKFQDSHNKGFTVRLATRTAPGLGSSGFESYASFGVTDKANHVVAYTNLSYYRLGRVVIRLGLDVGTMSTAESKQLSDDVNRALTATYARVNALHP